MATPVVTPWWESRTIQASVWIVVAATVGALVPMLQSREMDWWSLGATTAMALLVALKRMFDPDIQGPASIMNKNNLVSGGG